MSELKLKFLGGTGTVTGSKFLVEAGESRILVDCGLFQGVKELRVMNWAEFPVDPRTIDAVVLTHAHLDHSGYIPLLVKKGFKGKVFCTAPTRALSQVILNDFAHIQEEDADQANRGGYSKHSPARPLYTSKDVAKAMTRWTAIGLHEWVKVVDGIRIRFSTSGHILGSVFVEVEWKKNRIVFSGDLGRVNPLLLQPPERVKKANFLVVESTYGDRFHSQEAPEKALGRVVNETLSRMGHVIIPSFAVGRTQDLLYLLSRLKKKSQIPNVPIFLDTPMGIDATEIFLEYRDWHKLTSAEMKAMGQVATLVRSHTESLELTRSKTPCVIIAGSGMLAGGRVLHHLERVLPDPRHTVLLVGYQAPGTRGRQLRNGQPDLKIHGNYVPVRCQVAEIDTLSAHADQAEILEWLEGFQSPPAETFLVHGEPAGADALRVKISDLLGWKVRIPKMGDSVPLA